MNMELEDRLWVQLEAAADREALRGHAGRGAATARAALPTRRLIPAAATLVAIVAAVATMVTLGPQTSRPQWTAEPLGLPGSDLTAGATGFGSLWTYDLRAGQVLRVDPRTHHVTARLPLPTLLPNTALAIGDDAVWAVPIAPITHAAPSPNPSAVSAVQIDPRTARVMARVSLRAPDGSTIRPVDVVAVPGAVWAWGETGALRIDPATDRVTAAIKVPGEAIKGFAATDTRMSVVTDMGRLVSFDARTGARLASFPVSAPTFGDKLVAIGDAVVVGAEHGSIASIDAGSGRTRWTAHLGSQPRDLTLTGGRLWILMSNPAAHRDEVLALDPGTGHVVVRVALPGTDARSLAPNGTAPLITTDSGDIVVLSRR
jgi:outer membrane protein assembly factor BamB